MARVANIRAFGTDLQAASDSAGSEAVISAGQGEGITEVAIKFSNGYTVVIGPDDYDDSLYVLLMDPDDEPCDGSYRFPIPI